MSFQNLVWIRRDIRLHDHHALSEALKNGNTQLIFIFDPQILNKLKNKQDRRITFILESLIDLERKLRNKNASLMIEIGKPVEVLLKIQQTHKYKNLFFNRDYEPYAKERDQLVEKSLKKIGIEVKSFKDHVFFEKHEVLNQSREIYKVFTPYKNKWVENFKNQESIIPDYKCNLNNLFKTLPLNKLIENDFHSKLDFINMSDNSIKGGSTLALKRLRDFEADINNYHQWRDLPAYNKTSNLSTYIRHGNVSIRDMIRLPFQLSQLSINEGATIWWSEIIWRDFYQMILDVYPKVENFSFKPQYDDIKWLGTPEHFKLWCQGETGFPIIDASMRCLNATGIMHNRLRMIVASFLCKTLLLDWRLGEKYFAEKLLDFDLAANNGGWQWCASTGVDAQPYFRIFNPYSQSEKFDRDGDFIRSWCPELSHFNNKNIHSPHDTDFVEQARAQCVIGQDYPHPIVSYSKNREKALIMYKKISN